MPVIVDDFTDSNVKTSKDPFSYMSKSHNYKNIQKIALTSELISAVEDQLDTYEELSNPILETDLRSP